MSNLTELRLQARLSIAGLARLANIDRSTVQKAENGIAIQDVKAYAIVDALRTALRREIALSDVEGLNIR